MNVTQTSQVLAKIQAFNNRTFDKPAIMAWHDTIGDLDLEDSLKAVTDYFKKSKEWIMPSDIRAGVSEIRKARVEAMRTDIRLREDDEDLDNLKLSIARHRHLRELIAAGNMNHDQYHAYLAGTIDVPGMPKAITK